jgi:hypothetical protein
MSEKYEAISSLVGGWRRMLGSWLLEIDWE